METAKLRKFAQFARRSLIEQVRAKLKLVLAEESPARRESPSAIKKLEEAIAEHGKEQVVERVAYIWFNRLVALRFMDVNRYNRIGVVSPAEGQFQPEILADAKMGHIDEEMVSEPTRQKIFALLDGKTPSQDPQGEAYRLLVVAACNYWYSAMQFLFERIDDYTELLMPDDLLSGNSILAYTREAMTPDACEDVEVIGWLYQFYISEKKDQVFADLKKNKKVTPENIPAATQLFTPHWIVRYLVENSLGRLWMLNRPDSGLIERMDYYIKPEEPETDFLRINSPEEIKICDPACGSGHMLTYAFDLLYAIYEEEGYEPTDIPAKILTHNLYGIEIDERAGELAAFALIMKARAKQRRFFRKPVQPNICVLENIRFEEDELTEYLNFIGSGLFTAPQRSALNQFEEADKFGSLIRPEVTNVDDALQILDTVDVSGQLFLADTHAKVLTALRQVDYMRSKYHVVVANPPYMSVGGMSRQMKAWAEENYPDSYSDTFAMFVERAISMTLHAGMSAMVTMQSWLFLSSFEGLREKILRCSTIRNLSQIGYNSFPELNSKIAQAAAFVIENRPNAGRGVFFNLNDAPQSSDKGSVYLEKLKSGKFFTPKAEEFRNIPGSPVAYWATDTLYEAFNGSRLLANCAAVGKGLDTGDNERFLRIWFEVDNAKEKWVPCQKGGPFRKWFGNNDFVINWEENGYELKRFPKANLRNSQNYFRSGISWTRVSSAPPAFRYFDEGQVFESTGPGVFCINVPEYAVLGLLNSNFARVVLGMIAPTLDFQSGHVSKIPVPDSICSIDPATAQSCVALSRSDWDAYEISRGFASPPLLDVDYRQPTLNATYLELRAHWREVTLSMQHLEEENNRIFIDAYGLHDELTPEVPLEEITLTCNPHYRYGNNKSEEELEPLLLADTMRELVSYAVGCMFGRYALEEPGLILANEGETIEDYLKRVPEPSFPADDDNVIPMLDGDWFTDDITERFREFLRIAFGEEHYEENLRFVEQALGKDIRKYFLKDFYNDHVRRYKKRPIYWLFSSPKGSFNALIYMHRYQPHTVGTVLEYLRDFKDEKLKARKDHLEAVSISAGTSQGEKTKALKEIEKINKILVELDDYERDVLYPLATEQVEIDLDEGVKTNYPRFGEALKKIPGLS
jgi:type II restriction/modification system DNA methylase subunit YeeA